jgi:acetolactate synthase small subunit
MNTKARFRLKGEQRTTFAVQAQNQSNILLPVVSLFQELSVGIDAIYMIRRKHAQNVTIIITVQIGWELAVEVETHLSNVAGVVSVKAEMDTKALFRDWSNKKTSPRAEA